MDSRAKVDIGLDLSELEAQAQEAKKIVNDTAEAAKSSLEEVGAGLEKQARAARSITEGLAGELQESLAEVNKRLDEINKRRADILRDKGRDGAAVDPEYVALGAERRGMQKRQQRISDDLFELDQEVMRTEKARKRREQRSWLDLLIYGDEEPGKSKQRRRADVQNFSRNLRRDAILLHSAFRGVGVLPGGGLALAGLHGFTDGYQQGAVKIDPETGEPVRRGGLSGMAHRMGGGLKGAGLMLGFSALAASLAAAVMGGRRDDALTLSLGRAAGGDRGLGSRGLGLAYATPGLSVEEAGGIVGGAYREAGTVGAARASLRAQQAAGMGGQFSGLMGAMARVGGDTDRSAMKTWQDIFAAGMVQGLERGRFHELIAGATSIANQRMLGTVIGSGGMTTVAGLQAVMGQGSAAFRGQRGFEMIGSIDRAMRGEGSPVSQAMALMAGGLGSGSSYIQSKIAAQQGLAGEGGLDRFQGMMENFRNMFGEGAGDEQIHAFSRIFGVPEAAAQEFLRLNLGNVKQENIDDILSKYKSEEQKAFDTMTGSWQSIDKKLQEISSTLGNIFQSLGGTGGLIKVLEKTNKFLGTIARWVAPEDEEARRERITEKRRATLDSIISGLEDDLREMESRGRREGRDPTNDNFYKNVEETLRRRREERKELGQSPTASVTNVINVNPGLGAEVQILNDQSLRGSRVFA